MLLFEALAARGAQLAESGDYIKDYKEGKVDWVIHLSAAGEYQGIALQPISTPLPQGRSPRGSGTRAFLVDDFLYTLGAGTPGAQDDETTKKLADFKSLVKRLPSKYSRPILAFLNDPKRPLFFPVGGKTTGSDTRALSESEVSQIRKVMPFHDKKQLRGLNLIARSAMSRDELTQRAFKAALSATIACHPAGEQAEVLPISATAKTKVRFQIEGLRKDWWLDPEAQKVHREREIENLRSKGEESAECSICGVEGPLARVMTTSARLKGTLSSFNMEAYCSYGKSQSFNACMCEECSIRIGAGLDDLVNEDTGTCKWFGGKSPICILWWFDSPDVYGCWPFYNEIWDQKEDEKKRQRADEFLNELRGAGEGYYAVIEQVTQGRLACRRFHTVDGDEIADRFEQWFNRFGVRSIKSGAFALHGRELSRERDPQFEITQERLYHHLIGGEPIPSVVIADAEKAFYRLSTLQPRPRGKSGSKERDSREKAIASRKKGLKRFLNYIEPGDEVTPSLETSEQAEKAFNDLVDRQETPQDRSTVFLARAFARAEWIQVNSRRPQRTIAERMEACLRARDGSTRLRRVMFTLINTSYNGNRRVAGKGGDKRGMEYLRQADTHVTVNTSYRPQPNLFLTAYGLQWELEKLLNNEKRAARTNTNDTNATEVTE